MTMRWIGALLAAGIGSVGAAAAPAPTPDLKVERVVMLMRHGIRPPTKAQPIPAQYSPQAWPTWSVDPGLLTERGAKGIALLGASDRDDFVASGLLPANGCAAQGAVSVEASNKSRAIETAEVWAKALLPGCAVAVAHPAVAAADPLFHALDEGPAWFDGARAYAAALWEAPPAGLPAQQAALAPEIERLEVILGCAAPACDLQQDATRLVAQPHDRPDLEGALDIASTASQSLLLEYLEGKPMSEVGWGRASRDDIERLLVFHPVKFKYANRTPFIAKAAAAPLLKAMVTSLTAPSGPRVALFAGHDTNLADVGGLLDLHWHAASYPADDVPPGGALCFELQSVDDGDRYVRAFFRSQTMDQLRNLERLGPANPPFRQYVDIPGCGKAAEPKSCNLSTFTALVTAKTGDATQGAAQ
jgi:4-phytase/acid phosphatase